MIQQKMIEVFKEKEKTEGDVLDMLDKAFEMAKKNKDPKEMRLVAEDFRDMFDMEPEKPLRGMLPYGEEVPWEEGEIADEIEAAQAQLPSK